MERRFKIGDNVTFNTKSPTTGVGSYHGLTDEIDYNAVYKVTDHLNDRQIILDAFPGYYFMDYNFNFAEDNIPIVEDQFQFGSTETIVTHKLNKATYEINEFVEIITDTNSVLISTDNKSENLTIDNIDKMIKILQGIQSFVKTNNIKI